MDVSPKNENNELKKAAARVANCAECTAAINQLSARALQRLKSFAAMRTVTSRGVHYYADAEDLLHDAITRTLDGRRKWKPQRVDLTTHLKGCMRSIANQYDKESRRLSQTLPGELAFDGEERLHRATMLHTARLLLKPDAVAFEVLNLLLDGHTAGTVRGILNIDSKIYNAARKRITRLLQAEFAA